MTISPTARPDDRDAHHHHQRDGGRARSVAVRRPWTEGGAELGAGEGLRDRHQRARRPGDPPPAPPPARPLLLPVLPVLLVLAAYAAACCCLCCCCCLLLLLLLLLAAAARAPAALLCGDRGQMLIAPCCRAQVSNVTVYMPHSITASNSVVHTTGTVSPAPAPDDDDDDD